MSNNEVLNWINGQEIQKGNESWIDNINPHNGTVINRIVNSTKEDVEEAIATAHSKFNEWSALTPVKRGQILSDIVVAMKNNAQQLANCIALETGKPPQDAKGEVGGAIMQAEYFAGEGMRLYARSLTSGMPGKYTHTVRQARGVAGLIVPANTPIANIAWKTFPALICGNTVVLKAAEDSPEIANIMAKIMKEAGLPDGVFNVVHGYGHPAGTTLVNDERVSVISFTGSTAVGRLIAENAGKRLARISLELGGKNPFVVCDDADLDKAVHWASLSAFSNAGQRCAAGSRVIVMENVYDDFKAKFIAKAKSLRLGVDENSDLGPVINQRQHHMILSAFNRVREEGGVFLCGGNAPKNENLKAGYYITPTIIEGIDPTSKLSQEEIFGPVTILYKVNNLDEALAIANGTEYGLTAAIHTTNVDRAMWFAQRVKAGVANVNIGTYGSEPHMPFGGFGSSGNGSREPGVEALDVYSELKSISFLVRDDQL